jgi:hypothetical protein
MKFQVKIHFSLQRIMIMEIMLIFTYNTRIEALKIFQKYIQNTIV